jgi:hypothetical protein
MTRNALWLFSGLLSIVFWIGDASAQRFRWDHEFGQTGPSGSVRAMAEYGGDMYVGGYFTQVGTMQALRVARWSGGVWSEPGGGLDNAVFALAAFDGLLFAGGQFSEGIASWDGTQWSDASSGLPASPVAYSFAVIDGELWAGVFSNVSVESRIYVKSDASSAWSGYGPSVGGAIRAIPWDGNDDVALFGTFGWPVFQPTLETTAGFGVSSLTAMPDDQPCCGREGFLGFPVAGAYFDGRFYVGGGFGELCCMGVRDTFAHFEGNDWIQPWTNELGGWPEVLAMMVFDEGEGDHLIVGAGVRDISQSYDPPLADEFVNRIGRYDGSDWSSLCTGVAGGSARIEAMCEWDGGVAIGGSFSSAGGMSVVNVARWFFDPCIADWDGVGGVDFFDYLAFQTDFGADNMRADLDCDGELTFFDSLEFSDLYSAGCP